MPQNEYYSGGGEKTVAKTVILDKYLWAYLSIMEKHWGGEKWYVDTHAGTGFTNEMGVNIPGSTLRALNHNFDRYYFYEKDPDHFDTLVETLEQETGESFHIGTIGNRDDRSAFCEDPRISVANMDCNEGVKFLTRNSGSSSHWFTFVDPEKFSVERELMESLRRRGNMDILFNFQTTAFFRNAGENAEHSHDKVATNLGDHFPIDGTPDDYVNFYKEDVFENFGWKSKSRKMISEGSNEWRYDLIFASQNETAVGIMDDIFDSDLKNDVTEEINDWRDSSEIDQSGLNTFIKIDSHGEDQNNTPDDDEQSCLGDF